MTDAHQPFGQYVHQEPADKLAVMQGHDLVLIIPVVFVVEPNLILLDVDDTLIADRNAMRITCEVSDDAVGSI